MVESRRDHIHKLVENAEHASVDSDILETSVPSSPANLLSGDSVQRTIYSYLDDEQPHFIFHAERNAPVIYGPPTRDPPTASVGNSIYHIVTDQRWFMLAGNRGGNETLSIALENLTAASYDAESQLSSRIPSQITNSRIILETSEYCYKIPVAKRYDSDDFEMLLEFLGRVADVNQGGAPVEPERVYTRSDKHEADPRTIATLLDEVPPAAKAEADRIVAETDDADELVQELRDLNSEYKTNEEPKTINDVVADADSVDDLRKNVRTPTEETVERIAAKVDASASEVRRILEEADPEVVGEYAVSTARAAQPFLDDSGRGEVIAKTAAMLGGAAVGAYADTHPDSKLNDIDPIELAQRVHTTAEQGAKVEEFDGRTLGAMLGASSYLGEVLTPEEYADWAKEADPEAVILGAERGAEFALKQESGTQRQGMVYGAGVGLFASYALNEPIDSDLKDTLDEELYKEYLQKLAENDAELP